MRVRPLSLVLGFASLALSAQSPAPMTPLSPAWQAQWLLRLRAGQGAAGPTPSQAWRITTGQVEIPPAYDGTHLLVVQATPKKLQALDPATGSLRWEVPFTGLLDGPPQLAGNRVIFTLEGGRIGVLEAATGALRNLLTLPAWKPAKGSGTASKPHLLFPAVAGNTLVAAWSTPTQDPRPEQGVFAFDLATGALLWSLPMPGTSELHPLILGDRVLVGGGGQVMTVELATGRMLWGLKTPKRATFESCQLIEDRLFLRTSQEITAVDPLLGRVLWSQEVTGSSLLVGAGDRIVLIARRGAFNPTEWVLAFNARTGEKAWEWEAEEARLPWIQGGRVILNAKEDLLGLDLASGAPLWRRDLGGPLLLPLQVVGDTVLAAHRAKAGSRVVALRTKDGSEIAAAVTRDKLGAGLILGGPKIPLVPLAEGGVLAVF